MASKNSRDPADPNNNNKKKVREADPFRDFKIPAPALRNNRRHTIAPGAAGLPPPGLFAPPRPLAASSQHHHGLRQDDERLERADVDYQNYILALGRKLTLKKARARIQEEVDGQLSQLQLSLEQSLVLSTTLQSKLSVLDVSSGTANFLNILSNDMITPLEEQSRRGQDGFECVSENLVSHLNSLPTRNVERITVGENLDDIANSSGELHGAILQSSSVLENAENISLVKSEFQCIVESKSTLPTEHESMLRLQLEACNNVIQREVPIEM